MGDCLYECLKEAHLEKYYRNFTLNGLTNCEALIELSMQQYADYGIVAMDDRLKLFKLIQIVKSVQAEGISCQHEGHHKAHKTELGNKTANLHHKQNQAAVRRLPDNPENLHHKHNTGGVHRVPHLQERVSAGHGINSRPHASNANFLNNYQEQQNVLLRQGHVLHPAHNHHVAPPVARKTRSRTAHDPAHSNVVFRSGSDSPVFQCKKTLNFDDSNLDSSDEEIPPEKPKPAEEHPALISAKPNITQVPKPVPAQVHVENKAQDRFFPDAKTLQNESNFVHLVDNAQPEAPTQINGIPLQYVPRSFFIEVENGSNKTVQSVPNAHVREPNVNGVINFEDLPAQSLTKQQMMYTAQAQDAHRAASNFHSGVKPFHFKKFQSDTESKNDHAYFPKKTKERDPHVETVYNTGYNYGLPLSPQKSRVRTKSLDKIRVCVRKRPLVPREVKRGETDVVKVLNKNTVAVEEDKVSVDLTKFVQQHMFSFDEVFNDDSTNEDVYKRSVKPLLDCIFKRGTATCFAFGQTGSGKSYTLLGTKSIPGLYQLAGKDILKAMGAGETSGGRHLWVSYYEIYCSQLYDLLNKKKKLHVRENGKQRVCIAGLMETEITDIRNLIEVVNYGNLVRSTGTSGVNPQSSRSHAVLQLELRDGSDTRTGSFLNSFFGPNEKLSVT